MLLYMLCDEMQIIKKKHNSIFFINQFGEDKKHYNTL